MAAMPRRDAGPVCQKEDSDQTDPRHKVPRRSKCQEKNSASRRRLELQSLGKNAVRAFRATPVRMIRR
jgi:hypothetical protein